MAYAQALQYWMEKSNLPMLGQPCLLVGSILKLREVMEPYVSFDDTILDGVAPPEGFLEDQPEATIPQSAQPASTDLQLKRPLWKKLPPIGRSLEEPSTPQTLCEEQITRVDASQTRFPGWREVLYPTRPVTAGGQAPPVPHESRQRPHSQSSGGRRAWCQRAEQHQQVEGTRQESSSPPRPLEAAQEVAPHPSFKEVTACLQRDPSPATAFKVPPEPLQLEVTIEPAVAMMCTSCIVQDEAMGIIYMEMSLPLWGEWPLGIPTWQPKPKTHHRGHYQPPLKDRLMTTFGQKDCGAIQWEQSQVLFQLQGFVILVDTPWQLIASAHWGAQLVTCISTRTCLAMTHTSFSMLWWTPTMAGSPPSALWVAPKITPSRMDHTASGPRWVVIWLSMSAMVLSHPFWYSNQKLNFARAPTHWWPVVSKLGVVIIYAKGLLSVLTRKGWYSNYSLKCSEMAHFSARNSSLVEW